MKDEFKIETEVAQTSATAINRELLAACEVAIHRLDRLDDAGSGGHSPAYLQIAAAIAKAELKLS